MSSVPVEDGLARNLAWLGGDASCFDNALTSVTSTSSLENVRLVQLHVTIHDDNDICILLEFEVDASDVVCNHSEAAVTLLNASSHMI